MEVMSVALRDTTNFDNLVKTLLVGFNQAKSIVTDRPSCVVFGTTTESATAFVSNLVKAAKVPANVMCVGANYNMDNLMDVELDGYIILLPEVDFLANKYINDLAAGLNHLLQRSVDNHADAVILSPYRDLETKLFTAMYERYKDLLDDRRSITAIHEKNQYSRHYIQPVVPEECGERMIRLDPHKVHKFLFPAVTAEYEHSKYNTVLPCATPVYFTEAFAAFDARLIDQMLWAFSRSSEVTDVKRRLFVDDAVIEKLFHADRNHVRYVNDKHCLACAEYGGVRVETKMKVEDFY